TIRTDKQSLTPGETLVVRGELPARLHQARVEVRLERTPGSVPAPAVGAGPAPKEAAAREAAMRANFRLANDFTITRGEVTVMDGKFTARLKIPAKLPWPRVILRAHAATASAEAVAVEVLTVSGDKDKKSP